MKVLRKIIEKKGIPKAIYTDHAGWSGGGKRTEFSQFKRACDELGIHVIFANSPEGKGRIERTFRTVQDRLIPELRINKIKSMEKANEYLSEQFVNNYWNKEKTVLPDNPQSEYTRPDPFKDLDLILTVEETRVISNDQTVSWEGKRFKVKSNRLNYGSFEAKFKTDANGKTRVFVRDQEIFLDEIVLDPRAPEIDYTKATLLPINPDAIPFIYLAYMQPTICRLRNAVVQHQVSGKPLKIDSPKKKAG